jgi:hypothetical protein
MVGLVDAVGGLVLASLAIFHWLHGLRLFEHPCPYPPRHVWDVTKVDASYQTGFNGIGEVRVGANCQSSAYTVDYLPAELWIAGGLRRGCRATVEPPYTLAPA